MKTLCCLTLLSFISLAAEPRGSTHDAWSDWILDASFGEEIAVKEELSDNDSFEVDEEIDLD